MRQTISKRIGAYRSLLWRATTMLWLLAPPAPVVVQAVRVSFFLSKSDRWILFPVFFPPPQVASFRASVTWTDALPVIGVHVRHGDKGTEVDRLHETNEYVAASLCWF